MTRRMVVSSSLLSLLLLLLLVAPAEASDVMGALKDRNSPSHSAVALIFAFGLAVIVVIIAIVVLTLCCCDRPPPKRQHYVAAATTAVTTSAGGAAGGGGVRYDRVAAPAAVAAERPLYHGGLVTRTMPFNGSRYPRVHSPYLV